MNNHNLLALLLASTGLFVTGCRQNVDNQAAQTQTGERADGATATPASPPDLDYWAVISPLVAGTYNGQCLRLPDKNRTPGSFVVAPDGTVTASGLSETIRQGEIKLGRTIQNGVMTNLMEASDGELRIQLIDAGAASGVAAALTRQDKIVTCEAAPEGTGLRRQRLYPLFARMVEAPSEEFKCFDAISHTEPTPLPFKFNDGLLTLGADSFDFKAAEQEVATFSRGLSRVEYLGFLASKKTVQFELDESGRLRRFGAMAKDGKSYRCELS